MPGQCSPRVEIRVLHGYVLLLAVLAVFVLLAASAIAQTQTLTTVHSFTGPTHGGAWPFGGLIQATDGNFYGITSAGGDAGCTFGCGTIFKITPEGTLTMLYSFQFPDCCQSSLWLIQADNGNFYGTTGYGASPNNCDFYLGCGTVYEITPEGKLTTVYSFSELGAPLSGVIQARDGNFYGTTYYGGGGSCTSGCGTTFKITPEGTLTTLSGFTGPNGAAPGVLIQATDGNFYGITLYGGPGSSSGDNGNGTVFEMTPGGTLTMLYGFCAQTSCTDGGGPYTLIQAADGSFYGTTLYGGAHGNGTVFKITSGGTLTTIYSFCAEQKCSDGSEPTSLMQAADGNFYGTTLRGGGYGVGTIFEIISGKLTPIYKFAPSAGGYLDGANPVGVMQAADGRFYGTTTYGGGSSNCSGGCGTVFALGLPAGSTTTTLVSSLNPSVVGQAVTFTASVHSTAGIPPNGETVTFYNGSAVLGTSGLSGGSAALTTSSLPAGIFTITASYGGDANFAGSTSSGLRQVVNSTTKAATSTGLVSSLNPSIYGQKVEFTATVTTTGSVPPTGKVSFVWEGYSIGSATLNASGVASLSKSNLNVYTYPVTAVYSGDANNLGSTSAIVNQVVKEATSAAVLSASPNPSTQGQSVTFTATITSPTVTPTGPVTFTSGTTVLGTAELSAHKATFTTSTLPAGTTAVKATYAGNSNIAGSSASVTETVQP